MLTALHFADISARQLSKRAPGDLGGATEAYVGEWRRMNRGMAASFEREAVLAQRKWAKRHPGRPMPEAKIRGAISRAKSKFAKNFPASRLEMATAKHGLRVQGLAAGKIMGSAPARALAKIKAAVLGPLQGRWARDQRRLQKKMVADYAKRTTADLRASKDASALRRNLARNREVVESRADLIAQRETTALHTEATRTMHQRAGGKAYVWVETTSANPDPEHLTRVGQTFLWSEPPHDGAPGERPNCACSSAPVWE